MQWYHLETTLTAAPLENQGHRMSDSVEGWVCLLCRQSRSVLTGGESRQLKEVPGGQLDKRDSHTYA